MTAQPVDDTRRKPFAGYVQVRLIPSVVTSTMRSSITDLPSMPMAGSVTRTPEYGGPHRLWVINKHGSYARVKRKGDEVTPLRALADLKVEARSVGRLRDLRRRRLADRTRRPRRPRRGQMCLSAGERIVDLERPAARSGRFGEDWFVLGTEVWRPPDVLARGVKKGEAALDRREDRRLGTGIAPDGWPCARRRPMPTGDSGSKALEDRTGRRTPILIRSVDRWPPRRSTSRRGN